MGPFLEFLGSSYLPPQMHYLYQKIIINIIRAICASILFKGYANFSELAKALPKLILIGTLRGIILSTVKALTFNQVPPKELFYIATWIRYLFEPMLRKI